MRQLLIILLFCCNTAIADSFTVPNNNVVGQWQLITVAPNDSINTIAYSHDTSGRDILAANPDVPSLNKIRVGQKLLLPTCYLVPKIHEGIVVNLAEHVLFYFPDPQHVSAFPITIGKDVSPTPQGVFKVIKKAKNPTWFPTQHVRDEFKKRGVDLPDRVPAGPKNPLGKYVLYLNTTQYWIHTTPNITELGGNRSFGCVRMYQKDIEQLYNTVPLETPVRIISEPVNYLSIAKFCLPASSAVNKTLDTTNTTLATQATS